MVWHHSSSVRSTQLVSHLKACTDKHAHTKKLVKLLPPSPWVSSSGPWGPLLCMFYLSCNTPESVIELPFIQIPFIQIMVFGTKKPLNHAGQLPSKSRIGHPWCRTTSDELVLSCFSESTSLVKNVPLQDSITTWQFTGISLSRTLGEESITTVCVFLPLQSLKSPFSSNVPSFFCCLSLLRYLYRWAVGGNCP